MAVQIESREKPVRRPSIWSKAWRAFRSDLGAARELVAVNWAGYSSAWGGMSAFIESAIRFDFASALSTLTFTICPGLTASEGSLMKRLESSLMCTNAMT